MLLRRVRSCAPSGRSMFVRVERGVQLREELGIRPHDLKIGPCLAMMAGLHVRLSDLRVREGVECIQYGRVAFRLEWDRSPCQCQPECACAGRSCATTVGVERFGETWGD